MGMLTSCEKYMNSPGFKPLPCFQLVTNNYCFLLAIGSRLVLSSSCLPVECLGYSDVSKPRIEDSALRGAFGIQYRLSLSFCHFSFHRSSCTKSVLIMRATSNLTMLLGKG